ncbi:TetR/AcrR family transcriptional regulator C-terminal domain-containing protein [Actinospica durhamensis]|uniref:TetR/AcrR family transcriptional regulator C-terminal domain-containing protein n=1 Tax=Actinospica durhamensis TaxID=1508375 RepID=A0A941IV64_9ACTN|nr:TetR/AcrR family transcriptional regulator C-terminal domain-containing protein [Actinospica durhamensis]MBR7836516.1 TetR/AcrR family transcriptional regulator C-terminal domain-containing protein [Actinospica durhamensis]
MSRKLAKDDIVRAALATLDAEGLEGLTLRRVAARLDVQAPALYWHVRDKQELLDEMGTEVWRRISLRVEQRPVDEPWRAAMAAYARIVREELLAHRDGVKMATGTTLTDVEVLRRREPRLAAMIRQGFTVRTAAQAHVLLHHFVIGFCLEEQAVIQAKAAGDPRYSLTDRDARVDREAFPLVAEAGREIFEDDDRRFEQLVELILGACAGLTGG